MKKKFLSTILSLFPYKKDEIFRFPPRHSLLDQGQKWERIVFLLQGSVEVVEYNSEGRKNISTYLYAPQFLGLIEYLTDQEEIFSKVYSLTEGSCILLEKREVERLLEERELFLYFLRYLAKLNQDNISLRSKERLLDKKMRILDFFYETACHSRLPARVSFVKEDLSDLLQIPIRSLYRYLKELEDEGYFTRKGRDIYIDREQAKKIQDILPY